MKSVNFELLTYGVTRRAGEVGAAQHGGSAAGAAAGGPA